MERMRGRPGSSVMYDAQEEPIVLSKPLIDTLLRENNPPDLIALYTFYYYTAKWQKTNQVKATTGYVARGLRWSENRVRATKNVLRKLKLIEDLQARRADNRQLIDHYVKVNFIWSRRVVNNLSPTLEVSDPVANLEGNALSNGIINALSTNNLREEDVPPSQQHIKESLFENFWKLYPKHGSKGATLTVWKRLCKKPVKDRPLWKDLRSAIIAQKKSDRWRDKQFIPLSTTWLNQSRWLDDPAEMKAFAPSARGAQVVPPEDIVKARMMNVPPSTVKNFLENILSPALHLVGNTDNGDKAKVALGLCATRDWLIEQQKNRPVFKAIPERSNSSYFTYCNWNMVPMPITLLMQYVEWLGEQHWVERITPGLFFPDGKMFQRFLVQCQKEVGINFSTGGEV